MSYQRRFQAYLSDLHGALGDRRRRDRFDTYCSGLMMNLERKSVEPIAATLGSDNVSASHQGLLHFVAEAPWSDAALLERIEARVDAAT